MTGGILNSPEQVQGRTVYDPSGSKIGTVGQVWLDDATGQPEWITVNTGFFGMNESFLPVQGLRDRSDGDLETSYRKDQVKDAPNLEPGSGHLEPEQEQGLYEHYELTGGNAQDYGRGGGREAGDSGYDTSGPTTDDAMTRSEEQLRVGTERREAGQARLRKYVVTETEQVSLPVTREEVRLEREPITDANVGRAMDGPAISEEEHEVTLHEERPVVDTEAVPVERIRLTKDQVSDTETVSGEVRKERIEAEGTGEGRSR